MTNTEKIALCQKIVDTLQGDTRRPACRLRVSGEPFGLLDSHLGGTPYLPRETAYPLGAAGQPLWLCAQINFAQIPSLENFPDRGILQIYLSDWRFDGGFGLDSFSQDQDNWRVVYHPEADGTVTPEECRAKMPIPWEAASMENMGRPRNALDEMSLKSALKYGASMEQAQRLWRTPETPLALSFAPAEAEPIGDEDFRFRALFAAELARRLPGADPEEFLPWELEGDTPQEQETLEKLREQLEQGGCKLGGYPRFLQDDPREDPYQGMTEEELKRLNIPMEEVQKARTLAAWDTLLFQLDDDTSTFPAGVPGKLDFALNGGTLNFLIRREDLRNRDFSQVLGQWACT